MAPIPSRQRLACLVALLLSAGCADLSGNGNGIVPATYDTTGGATDTGGAQADSGAVADTGGQPDSGKTDAGKTDAGKTDTGKADTAAGGAESCQGKCGAKYNPKLKCQCNTECTKYGNCCADYGPLCNAGAYTCKGRCSEPFDKSKPCQCTWDCSHYGSCCPDYLPMCHADDNLEFQEADADELAKCNKPLNLANVEYAKDGDTLQLTDGNIVRLLVVNTPELKSKDCYSLDALNWTKAMVKKVKTVCLIMDPAEGDKDQYDRLLRYVYYKDPAAGGKWVNMNLRLVRLGYGPVFYPYAKDQKWEPMGLLMQEKARTNKVGGWGKCGWK